MNTHISLSGLLVASLAFTATAFAADSDTTLLLRPHCTDPEACESFTVVDPQTLSTDHFAIGDTVDLDVVALNPTGAAVTTVKALLSYDPYYLDGVSIEATDLANVAPGGADFSPDEGLARIEMSSADENGTTASLIVVAHVQFTVKQSVSPGSIISFSDAVTDGNTDIRAKAGEVDSSILSVSPGSLMVDLHDLPAEETTDAAESEVTNVACASDADCPGSVCVSGTCLAAEAARPTGSACTADEECESTLCREGLCREALAELGEECQSNDLCSSNLCQNGTCAQPCQTNEECASGLCYQQVCLAVGKKLPVGAACEEMEQCESNLCLSNVCRDAQDMTAQRTAFELLSVQDLRLTTDTQNVYLAWKKLENPLVKGYNLYYGTKEGSYSHRRTLSLDTTSLVLRDLTVQRRYYFAIRAVSAEDEEGPLSESVSVVVGNAGSASAPLLAGNLNAPPNPLSGDDGVIDNDTLPGTTGVPSLYLFLLCAAAGVGIVGAAIRQSRMVRKL